MVVWGIFSFLEIGMFVLVIECPNAGVMVEAGPSVQAMRALAEKHAGQELIDSGWPNENAVATLCAEGGDVTYSIHHIAG